MLADAPVAQSRRCARSWRCRTEASGDYATPNWVFVQQPAVPTPAAAGRRSAPKGALPPPPVRALALSREAAIKLVLNAALGRVDDPTVPETTSRRRNALLAFTCKRCGVRTTTRVNRQAMATGTVIAQCSFCEVHHKVADHLKLHWTTLAEEEVDLLDP